MITLLSNFHAEPKYDGSKLKSGQQIEEAE